jgi:hypothetical protein
MKKNNIKKSYLKIKNGWLFLFTQKGGGANYGVAKYTLFPITFKMAAEFIKAHHRHNSVTQGHKFSIGLMDGGELIGVVTVGRPISRHRDDGVTAEVTRCCVLEGCKNANSKLYAAAWRAAKAMGYRQIITYTLESESGPSLRAAGFQKIGVSKGNKKGWNVPARPRKAVDKYPYGDKTVWGIRKDE